MITVSQLKEVLSRLPTPDSVDGDVIMLNVDSFSDGLTNSNDEGCPFRVIKFKKIKNYSSFDKPTLEWGVLDIKELY